MNAIQRLAAPARARVPAPLRDPVAVVYALVAILVAYAAISSADFRSPTNVTNILQQSVLLGIIAIGQTLVVLAGGIDFSVAAVVKLSTFVGGLAMAGSSGRIAPAVIACLATGAGIGLVNGLTVTWFRAAPFIVTFGMAGILTGLSFTISTQPRGQAADAFLRVYDGGPGTLPVLGPLPYSVIAVAVVWFLAWLLVVRTPFGRRILAVGGNAEAARLAGIPLQRIRVAVYVLSGALAALGGLYALARSGVGDPTAGDGLEFDSITAVALGGTSLFGGAGGIPGTLGGVLLLTLIGNVFNLLQISTWYQGMLKGGIILLAVALYRRRR